MLTSSLGHVSVTEVDGTTFTGLYAADGSLNVYDATSDTVPNGLYHPCGAMNITITDGTTLTGRYANNGSLYVVIDSTQYGVYHSCGAMNITGLVVSNATSFLSTYGPYGMVMDFTDASIAIKEASGVLDFRSQGQVSNGLPIGPGAKTTYSAPSAKLTEQADGFLKFQAHNLALWSEAISNAAWNKSNVTVSGTVATATGAASNKFIRQLNLVSGGPSYSIQFDVAAGTHSLVQIYTDTPTTAYANFDLANGVLGTVGSTATATIEAIGGGVYRCTANFVSTGTNARLSFIDSTSAAWNATSSSTGTISVTRAHFRRTPSVSDYIATTTAAAYDLPYVYSGGVRQEIMVEPAATNLALQSADLSSGSWTRSNLTATSAGDFWYILNDGVASGVHTIAQSVSFTSGTTYVFSMIAENIDRQFLQCYPGTGAFSGAGYANFDLAAGTVSSSGGTIVSASIEALGTGGYRCVLVMTATATTSANINWQLIDSGSAGRGPTYTGSSKTLRARLPQVETGTVATSPIITYGAAVARVADSPLALLNLFPSIGTAYTIYAKYKPQSASVATTVLQLDDTTANELVRLDNKASGQGRLTVEDGGVTQASPESSVVSSTAFNRLAASIEANNVRIVVNGGAAVQDTSVTLPTLTRLLLGGAGGMELAQLAILPGARTEAQLQALGA